MKKLLAALLVTASAIPASAVVVTYTDRAAFTAATSNPVTETFSNAPASSFAYQGPTYTFGNVTAGGNGDGSFFLIDENFNSGQYSAGSGGSLYSNGSSANFTIAGGTTAFGLDFATLYNSTATFNINTNLGTFTAQAPGTGIAFFGLTTDTPLTWINFDGLSTAYPSFDNVTTASVADVPEPAMLGLFGLGAIGLGLSRRRKAA